ncbi:glycosyltransferase [Cellulosimicrobium protaetiae]|uniref:D-inositol 3-phosphate glycosyltransferase n=1 Tax=Cellulosimicrobium protaetiae TaxID=2587808 RepID=A0A6M5UFD8_9MICO|nr:glycosyltransferase [Cellulosimicrobium protaetiae]QJW35975.1 glycosyltransferase [Cellulosimicrobium protaetiae]
MKVLRVSHSAVVDAWRERERALRARGLDVRLLSARAWDEGGTTVPLVPRPGEPVRGVRTFGTHPALFVYDPVPLWRALGQDWDVLDLHEEPFALATAEVLALRRLRALLGRRPAPPYVLYSAQNLAKRYPWPFRWFEARALRGAAAVSVCNDEAGRIVRAKGARGRVETVPLGVDPAVFSPAPDAVPPGPSTGRTPRRLRVGYAGRLASHKGVDALLAAVAADDRLDLVLAGEGPDRASLERAARPLGDRVRFVGALDGDDLVAFYRDLDALAVPSRETPGWVEQFGRVAVEAMACGVPVVASRTGALPDVVGGAGLLVPPDDPDALRAALVRVLDEDGLADRLRAAAADRAASCSWAEVARRYEDLYTTAVSGGAAPTTPTTAPRGASASTPPEVVVVAYGSPAMVRDALAPLAGKYPITVVDNSSLPEIREITELAGGRYLDPGRNGGFAAGVNHALAHRQAPGADVLLLNPDAVVTPEDVETLHRALHASPRVASVGPQQVDDEGTPARVVWPFPSPAATWIEAVGLARLRRTPADRSFVIGSVLLLDAAAVEELGGLDERFFLYAEETDWAYRAVRAGWRHAVVPEARATHLGGATSTDPTRRETHFHASQERYLRKHHGRAGWAVARVGAVLGAAVRSVALTGEGRASARRRLRLYLTGPVRAESAL